MRNLWLLPSIFLKIGLGFIVFSMMTLLIHLTIFPMYLFNGEQIEGGIQKGVFLGTFNDEIFYSLLTIGLLFLGYSKSKIEDERTIELRRKAAFFAILLSLIWVMFIVIAGIFLENIPVYQCGIVLVLLPLALYNLSFFYQILFPTSNHDQ